ncbi:MAG: hypothetical protein HY298_11645 [Verrucomicrobia bacterium]|nr:hypothetical protein [Verrucomicrobiota bacterium]
MSKKLLTNLLMFGLALSSPLTLVRAEDIVTSQGKTYKNAEIIRVDSDSVVIKHDAGEDRVGILQLPPSALLAELQRQLAEREKLKEQLATAQAEIRKLKNENEGVKQENQAVKQQFQSAQTKITAAQSREEKAPSPTPPLAGLPPIKKDEVVPAHDIVNHYQADRTTADQRYRKQFFKVRGVVERLDKPLFVSKYVVFLKSFNPAVKVECNVQPPPELAKIYVKDADTLMVARSGGEAVALMKVGDEVTLEGRCSGLDNSRITFQSCTLVR